ncbi:hypothetical protein EVA_02282 [gut metagenome]|uniref:Uncharacterized protein n=1 Tax=gut metagenome TaxID=749906 RepID=J9H6C1_9ZZZZ
MGPLGMAGIFGPILVVGWLLTFASLWTGSMLGWGG